MRPDYVEQIERKYFPGLRLTSRERRYGEPAYDPKRDGKLKWESEDARITGCPPIGRRAIDRVIR